MNNAAAEKVCLLHDGRELTHFTGVEPIDRLLGEAQPEGLAIGLVCLTLANTRSALATKLRACLEERLEPFTDGDLADKLDADAEVSPSREWLALLAGLRIGQGCVVKSTPTVQTERERVSERDADFIQSRRFETEDFHRLSATAQRVYLALRNTVPREHVVIDRQTFDAVTPMLYVDDNGMDELARVMQTTYPADVHRLDQAIAELEHEKLVDRITLEVVEATQ